MIAGPTRLDAHPLQTGTTRLTLRDGHVTIHCEWDVFSLVDAPPTVLATASDEVVTSALRDLEARLIEGTQLWIDGTPATLALRAAPSAAELRATAAILSSQGREHGALVRLRFESDAKAAHARQLELLAPASMGSTLVSFVQPVARMTAPGASATFEVLSPPGRDSFPDTRAHVQPAGDTGEPRWLWALAGGVIGLSVSRVLRTLRRRVVP